MDSERCPQIGQRESIGSNPRNLMFGSEGNYGIITSAIVKLFRKPEVQHFGSVLFPSLGHGLDLPVVAEGVETAAQLAFLSQESCNEVQGYLIGRPHPIEQYAETVGRRPAAQPRTPTSPSSTSPSRCATSSSSRFR